ncbi:hypothetical protein IW261DRAFT_13667 [Armillaria novae-zelandiae]|uniref:Fucose-specific lectin n=1 Tax=Armillaria novae-zelandiae TaxID=153914 RepID=A0AA39TIH5_9AGAR|nr:hypothetical protein IW261DRAFT_13667 [Armillaria novae-zelandiae]
MVPRRVGRHERAKQPPIRRSQLSTTVTTREELCNDGYWLRGATLSDILRGSSITAVAYSWNGLQLRVYHQTDDLSIKEHCLNDSSGWFPGQCCGGIITFWFARLTSFQVNRTLGKLPGVFLSAPLATARVTGALSCMCTGATWKTRLSERRTRAPGDPSTRLSEVSCLALSSLRLSGVMGRT